MELETYEKALRVAVHAAETTPHDQCILFDHDGYHVERHRRALDFDKVVVTIKSSCREKRYGK